MDMEKVLNTIEKSKVLLSVAIITYNEEKNIIDCIQSCIDIADEIIILDSFSKDRTTELADSFDKVRVYQNKFQGHIEQKNKAIELCSGEWVLSLDADERLTPQLRESIQIALETKSEIVAYKLARLTYHLGKFIKHSGWYPVYRFRLFKKGYAYWTGENPHDYIAIEGKGKKLLGDILHYSFQDLSDQIDTINKFSSIVSFTRFQKGKRFSIIKSIVKPLSKFIEIYFIKGGFLDGYPGLVIAVSSAFSTFLKFAKMYEYQHKIIQRPSNLRKDYGNK